MNTAADNRRRLAMDRADRVFDYSRQYDHWQKMLLNHNDMRYAEVYGGVNIKNESHTNHRIGEKDL